MLSELTDWSPYIRSVARKWVYRWAWRSASKALIDDVESAAWEVIATLGIDNPRVHWEIQNAIQDEITRWVWGVTRSQRPRRLIIIAEEVDFLSHEPSPLTLLVWRETLGEVAACLSEGQISTWLRATWPINGREYRIPQTQRWRNIQQLAKQCQI